MMEELQKVKISFYNNLILKTDELIIWLIDFNLGQDKTSQEVHFVVWSIDQ